MKIFIMLTEKNYDKLKNGGVIYKRLKDPDLKNNLFMIATDKLTEKSVSKKILGEQLDTLKKENPDFIVSPVILQQITVDHVMKYNYCWTVKTSEFNINILSEKSYDAYLKRGIDALIMLDDNISFPFLETK